ncbi:MAG: metallophosphoesterase [Spirochaetaceae bacterium]|jgi:hypothetical protein|nr:metallophosphoesterase [Spirochaetaceae bacterium]
MKILCVADEVDPLVYSNSVHDRFGHVDYVLAAGDLPLDYIEFIVSSLNKPTLFVFGNHNLGDFHLYKKIRFPGPPELNLKKYFAPESSAGAVYVGGKVVNEDGLLCAGLGGSMRYNSGENQFSETGMMFEAVKLIPKLLYNKLRYGRYIDVLLTHAPPRGIHDKEDRCHRGFKTFLWFMRTFKPRYLVHGHIHLYDANENRETGYVETKVVNAFTHCVIEL